MCDFGDWAAVARLVVVVYDAFDLAGLVVVEVVAVTAKSNDGLCAV